MAEWLDRFDDDYEPELLTAEVERFWKLVGSGDNRHDAMLKVVVSALRKARCEGVSVPAARAAVARRVAAGHRAGLSAPPRKRIRQDAAVGGGGHRGGIENDENETSALGSVGLLRRTPARSARRYTSRSRDPMKIYDDVPEPGTEEYKQVLQQALWAKQLTAEVDAEDARRLRGKGASSWQRIDLHEMIYGELAELGQPCWPATTGSVLGYPGCTHSIHGPPGRARPGWRCWQWRNA